MSLPHISVCICTFRREQLLRRSLAGLIGQQSHGEFPYSIVVADNDLARSAEQIVEEVAGQTQVPFRYCVEPNQSIALARNKAVENASGEFVAFIDDDEIPVPDWLVTLYRACETYQADGVLGPVKPQFDQQPPKWVVDGKFYDRSTHPTGFVIDWRNGRTGNVLLKRDLFPAGELAFRPEFRTGEDQDFFRRRIGEGKRFVWCNEAVAYEVVPPVRWTRAFMLKRAMLRGAIEPVSPTFTSSQIAKSAAAVLAYTVALPLGLVSGQGRFMSLLYRLSYHAGVVLASAGLDPIKDPYVTS